MVDVKEATVPKNAPKLPSEGINYPKKKTSPETPDGSRELNNLDLIIPYLYLGDIGAAYDSKLHKELNITHMLTIEDNPINEDKYQDLENYKYKKLADHQFSNILEVMEECLEFIDEAVSQKKNILVHCFAGKSRSATLVLAYIMAKEKQSVRRTLDQVRKIRFVKPNMGFYKQLELFHAMDFKVNKESAMFRSFKLENIAKQIQLGNRYEALDKNSTDQNEDDKDEVCYKCKKCRFKLFNANKIVPHIKSYEQISLNSWNKKLAYFRKLGAKDSEDSEERTECKDELYIEPLDWFRDRLEDLSGKLNCPKCDTKVGSFDWCGTKCSCATWVTPAFHISIGKVDLCKPLPDMITRMDKVILAH